MIKALHISSSIDEMGLLKQQHPNMLSKLQLFLLLALFIVDATGDLRADGDALLSFFDGLQGAGRMLNWNKTTSPCSWIGVQCDTSQDSVVALKLPGAGLYGTIAAGTLGSLSFLQVLSLRSNHLSGHLPKDLINCMQLKKVFLQSNHFSGPMLSFNATSNPLLVVMDMSFNGFNGAIPPSLSGLPRLKVLLLQNNSLSGSIPPFVASLSQVNVSNNELNGSIPAALRSFPNSSFANNIGLCGPPLLSPCSSSRIAPSSSAAYTATPYSSSIPSPHHKPRKQLDTSAIVLIAIADAAFLFMISSLFMLWHYKKRASKPEGASVEKIEKGTKKPCCFAKAGDRYADDGKEGYSSAQEPEHCKLVFFYRGQQSFDLEDLLGASAEVLGKGTFGTSYKAVFEDGPTVVVKRLREASFGRKEFEQHMDAAGKMRHQNLVPMMAYYYSKEEKLLVHEYLPLGSLSAAIHGRKNSDKPALDWRSRLQICVAAARGLEYLHGTSNKYVHGDIKPSNILLHSDYEACISDYGLGALYFASANDASAISARMAPGYPAPEVTGTCKPTQKADVYSFGVVILELLTGKAPSQTSVEQGLDLPKWVQSVVREEWTSEVFDHELMKYNDIEEEMVHMLQIALQCVSASPEQRPTMAEVLKLIQDMGEPLSDPIACDEVEHSTPTTTTTTNSSSPKDRIAPDSPHSSTPRPLVVEEAAPKSVTAIRDEGMPAGLPSAAAITEEARTTANSLTPTSDTSADVTMWPAMSAVTPTTMTTTSTNIEAAMASSLRHK